MKRALGAREPEVDGGGTKAAKERAARRGVVGGMEREARRDAAAREESDDALRTREARHQPDTKRRERGPIDEAALVRGAARDDVRDVKR